ncbi:putative oxidoreductase [Rosa chinensis]|uniref:Putative oxidoreductase n=1 Tax=Rosa chinensis TaxID=74649 RepID=A0A2P6R147_ROSCH|nr:putative oxidoreductase [Rosa chinensis]
MMAATKIPEVVLGSSSGQRTMPVLGFGTATDYLDPNALKTAVLEAIKLGYRHFDTASIYTSEQTLREAVAEAISLGLIASRDQVFITSKMWCNDAHPDLVIPALKKSLQNLRMEYLDLYLIHWRISGKPGKLVYPLTEEDLVPLDLKGVWAAMEESQRLAYSPLGGSGTSWGSSHVLESKVLQEIAEARVKTIAQVCIRWVYQTGTIVVVKSYNKERLKQNVQVFDWELSEEDLDKINQTPQHKTILREEYVSANGPYKSLEEFWDGELNSKFFKSLVLFIFFAFVVCGIVDCGVTTMCHSFFLFFISVSFFG